MFEFFFKKKKRKVSLVLGGGGAKGFFHLGVINAIRDSDIEISEISGTSAGAIVGVMLASNPTGDFEAILKDMNLLKFLSLAFTRADDKAILRIEKLLRNYIKVSNFNELQIPMAFNATNIETGEEVVFRNGDIFPGIIASMAIPFIFPLIKIKDQYLCDGGVINNLPISLIKNEKNDIVVSDLNVPLLKLKNLKSDFSVAYNALSIMQKNSSANSLLHARQSRKNKIIDIELNKFFSTFDFRKNNADELVKTGYKETMKKLKRY